MVKSRRGTNSMSRTGNQMELNDDKFTSRENKEWYERKRNNTLIVEKTVHPEVERNFDIHGAFRTLGWDPQLNLSGEYYPELVKQFYANIENKESKSGRSITSAVKGISVILTEEYIANFLEIENEGPQFNLTKETVASDPTWKVLEAMGNHSMVRAPSRSNVRQLLLAKHLSIRDRLVVYMMSFNIMPRASSLNEVRISDLYFLDKMMGGLGNISGIPLAPIIIESIREVVRTKRGQKAFAFPILISRLLVRAGVETHGEMVHYTTSSDQLNERTLILMSYEFVGEQWRKKPEQPESPPHEDEPPPQEEEPLVHKHEEYPPAESRAQQPRRHLLRRIWRSCIRMKREIREIRRENAEFRRENAEYRRENAEYRREVAEYRRESREAMELLQSTLNHLVHQKQLLTSPP